MPNNEKIVLTSCFQQSIPWIAEYLKLNNVKKLACILDAKTPSYIENPNYVSSAFSALKSLNFLEVEGIFLEKENNLKELLSDYDALYVIGGNTFYLLNAMRKSGFDKYIKDLLASGLIYIGESAGSYVACPTIEMAHWKHQDLDIIGLDSLEGLNLVPYLITVHYKDEFRQIVEKAISKTEYEVKILTDRQLILRENGKDTLVEL